MQLLAIASWLPKYERKHLRGDVIAQALISRATLEDGVHYD